MGCVMKKNFPVQPHPPPRPPLEGEGATTALNADRDVINRQNLRRGDDVPWSALARHINKPQIDVTPRCATHLHPRGEFTLTQRNL